ncbi:MAG: hypothetical protein ACJAVO_001650 [Parvibaculaceae bacterium]|jgi:hypothetical protein
MTDAKVTKASLEIGSHHAIEPPVWTPEMLARRRQRSTYLAVALIAMVGLFFAVTVVKIGGNIVVERTL